MESILTIKDNEREGREKREKEKGKYFPCIIIKKNLLNLEKELAHVNHFKFTGSFVQ